MRFRSVVTAVALVGAVVAGVAAPAFAHEEISPKTFPTGAPTFFTLTAANEEEANLSKITIHAPAGLGFGDTTRSPAGWSVTKTEDTITWTGGAVKPDTFDTWGYEIEGADQPGTLAYKITLGFADGKSDDVEVDVNAVAPGAGGTGTATTVTTVPATSPTTASAESGSASSGGASGTAKAALAISIVALLVAAGALAVGGRKRLSGGAGRGADGGGARPAGQDW